MEDISGAERTRIVKWQDPNETAQRGREMSGIEYLRALQAGKLPAIPLAALIGMELREVEEGRIVFAAKAAEFQYNPLGTVHGGIIASLLDSAMGCAVQSLLPAGTGYTTLELKTNYLRAITIKTGWMYSEGKIIHLGGRIATAEGRVSDSEGKLYAHGTCTCLIMRP